MYKDKFLNIEIEEPPVELQLSVEMRIREVLKSDDYDGVKRYCTHLIRHQMKQDVFLAGLLVFRQFRYSDKDELDKSEALKEALRDLSVNQQQIVGSIKVITDTQTTSQAAIIKHV